MSKLLSTKYSATAFNAAMLIIRLVFGILLMNHGYSKLTNFAKMKTEFTNFLGMGQTATLALVVFAEFFCALFVAIGVFTRLAAIPVIVTMCVALFQAHHGNIFTDGEHATLYLGAYLAILLLGPGKISVDGMTGK